MGFVLVDSFHNVNSVKALFDFINFNFNCLRFEKFFKTYIFIFLIFY